MSYVQNERTRLNLRAMFIQALTKIQTGSGALNRG